MCCTLVSQCHLNLGYWSSTPVEEWEITNYDLNLCKQGPITKQAAHAHLLSDIKLLLNALPNNIRKQANVLSTQFKVSCVRKGLDQLMIYLFTCKESQNQHCKCEVLEDDCNQVVESSSRQGCC